VKKETAASRSYQNVLEMLKGKGVRKGNVPFVVKTRNGRIKKRQKGSGKIKSWRCGGTGEKEDSSRSRII